MEPETLVRQRIADVLEAEFTALEPPEITVENDKLPRAAGHDGRHRVAVYPEDTFEVPRDVNVLDIEVTLQFYMAFEPEINEDQAVDPAIIEAIAGRIRRAFAGQLSGTTNDLWFLRLQRITYPDDPTGNKTRLEARFTARAANPSTQ